MSLSAVVQEHVTLKRAGRTLKGLCPFHGEKTPSFHVDEQKGFFHCFGCQVGGDVYKFVMLKDALTFPEAVRALAERAGIEVPASRERTPQDDLRDRLLAINEAAQVAFAEALLSPSGEAARRYLEQRGISREAIEAFGLGWAPDSWDYLAKRLEGRFRERELTAAGVVSPRRSGQGVYDRFRARVTFPIRALSGKVVAFGGRLIVPDEQQPKYLNSPETPVYEKGRHLYALERARGEISRQGEAIVVEGYLDALSLHAHGVTNAVAVLGTALTPVQARLLRRYAERVVLNFDADAAGRKAARRSLDVLLPEGLEVKVLELPAGDDPDDHVRREGSEGYLRAVQAASTFFDFLIRRVQEEQDLSAPTGRVRALESLLPWVLRVEDRVLRSELSDAAADALRLPRALVQDEVRRKIRRQPSRAAEAVRRPLLNATRAERTLAAWLVADQSVRETFQTLVDESSLSELVRPELFGSLLEEPAESFDLARALDRIEDEEQRSLLSRCAVDPELEPVVRDGLEERVRSLVEEIGLSPKRRAARRKAEVEREFAAALARGDQDAAAALNAELQEFARQLHG